MRLVDASLSTVQRDEGSHRCHGVSLFDGIVVNRSRRPFISACWVPFCLAMNPFFVEVIYERIVR